MYTFSHNAQRHRQTDRQTDRRHYDVNKLLVTMRAVRSAKN